MRCGCPECGTLMIHSERDNACVCPECLYRCYACQGAGTALTREEVKGMKELFSPRTMEDRMRRAEKHEDEEC